MATDQEVQAEDGFAFIDSLRQHPEGLRVPWFRPDHFGRIDTWWHVEGRETTGPKAGSSCAFPGEHASVEDAETARDRLMADPANARYDTWRILEAQPYVRVTETGRVLRDPAGVETL